MNCYLNLLVSVQLVERAVGVYRRADYSNVTCTSSRSSREMNLLFNIYRLCLAGKPFAFAPLVCTNSAALIVLLAVARMVIGVALSLSF